jgi:flagellar hook assembly protein FlgD
LPQQCTISIFTISGELVKIIEHDDNFDSNVFWDLKNSKNKKVAPGLYIYKVDTNNGISKVGKFAIVR